MNAVGSQVLPAAPAAHAHSGMNGAGTAAASHPQAAAMRLELSRQRLLLAMKPPPPTLADEVQAQAHQLRQRQGHEHLQSQPAAAAGTPRPVVQDLLARTRAWWSAHPLHHVATLAVHSAESAARPMVRQHPVAWMLAAAACGAALAWTRPWRFVNRSVVAAALVPGVLPGLLPGLLRTLTPLLVPLLMPRVGPSMWARVVQALGALVPSDRAAAPRDSRAADTTAASPVSATATATGRQPQP